MTAAAEISAIVHNDLIAAPSGIPAKAIAEALGKNYFTMMKEANPAQPTHKYALDLLIPTMRLTGSTKPVERIAEEMGGVFTPIPKPQGPIVSSTHHCSQVLFGVAVFLRVVTEAYADGKISKEEFALCHKRAHQGAGEILALLECIRRDMEKA